MTDKNIQDAEIVQEAPPLNAKEELGEMFKTVMIALVLALIIRSFVYDPFNIPSGSMKPTLDVGDYLFVSKSAYGYSQYSLPLGIVPMDGRIMGKQPKRGDVVVFWNSNTNQNYIKRLIGLPGETVRVYCGRLYINGDRIARKYVGKFEDSNPMFPDMKNTLKEYVETLPDGTQYHIYERTDQGEADNTKIYTIPEEHYFLMGDNRDNSQDSRFPDAVGFVPYENLKGRADITFFSTNGHARLFEFWKWPWSVRFSRMFMDIDPDRPAPDQASPSTSQPQ
jgi:signal peptidase I